MSLAFMEGAISKKIHDDELNNPEPAGGGRDENGNTGLHAAAALGNTTDIMVEALRDRFMIEARNDLSQTPLHVAVSEGLIDSVVYLSWLGPDLEARDAKLNTPLILAAEKGRLSIVRYLLDKGARIEARNSNGETALHLASGAGSGPVVAELCARGARATRKTKMSRTPLHLAALSDTPPADVIELLLSHKADINASDDGGDTAVNLAAAKGSLAAVVALASRGADISKKNAARMTPLMSATSGGHSEVAGALLSIQHESRASEKFNLK